MSDELDIEVIDAPAVSLAQAAERAALGNAGAAVDAPHLEPQSAEYHKVRLVYGWDNQGGTYLLLARNPAGVAVGYAEVEYPRWDNHHIAGLGVEVHPDHRSDLTIADQLLARAEQLMRDDGKTSVIGDAWAGTDGAALWPRHGYTQAFSSAQRRIYTADLDWEALDDLLATSEAASEAYDIVELETPAPDEWIPALLDLHRTMNDAPVDDLVIDDDVWTQERYRGMEDAMTNRGIVLERLVARRRSDGEFGGFTVVAVEKERPHLGFQDDTAVVGEHRGHKLGLRLKIEMLRRLRERHPAIGQIDTWNAESNTHMLAVNNALGCVVVGNGLEFQKDLR